MIYGREHMECQSAHDGRCQRHLFLWPRHVNVKTTGIQPYYATGTGNTRGIVFTTKCPSSTSHADDCIYVFDIDPIVEKHTWWLANVYIFLATFLIPVLLLIAVVWMLKRLRVKKLSYLVRGDATSTDVDHSV